MSCSCSTVVIRSVPSTEHPVVPHKAEHDSADADTCHPGGAGGFVGADVGAVVGAVEGTGQFSGPPQQHINFAYEDAYVQIEGSLFPREGCALQTPPAP